MYPFVPHAAWSAAEATIIIVIATVTLKVFFSYLCTYDNCDYKSWFCTIIPIQCLYICLYRLASSWYNMMHIAYRAKLLDTETMITTRHIYRQYERHKDKIFIAQFKGLHRIQASQDKINANYCTRNLYGYLQHKTVSTYNICNDL